MTVEPSIPTATRCALLTPVGQGAIAVVQLDGPRCREVLARVFAPTNKAAPDAWRSDRLYHGWLHRDGRRIDEVVVVLRDVSGGGAAINLHGGVRVAQRAIGLLEASGCLRAAPAEMPGPGSGASRFAPVAAVDAAVLAAPTQRVVRWLLAQRRVWSAWCDALRVALDRGGSRRRFHRDLDRAEAVWPAGQRAVEGLRVAIAGPPNVGKSTLANRLALRSDEQTGSLVFDAAGTTRDWVSHPAALNGWPVLLIDTAGVDSVGSDRSADAIAAEAARRARQVASQADVVLAVRDIQQPAAPLEAPPRAIDVANKADLHGDRAGQQSGLAVSAKTGEGLNRLAAALTAAGGFDRLSDATPALVSRSMRQWADNLHRALDRRDRASAVACLSMVSVDSS